MKTSLRDRILRYLTYRPNQWSNGGEIERLASTNGYKPSNASRRLRELQEDGLVEVRYNLDRKHTAWYRLSTPATKVTYTLPDGREIITYDETKPVTPETAFIRENIGREVTQKSMESLF